MMALPDALVDRLAKVCGLLGSDKDGERSAAAFQATKILQSAGLTWREVIEQLAGPRPDEAPIHFDGPPSWRRQVDACIAVHWRLTDWEVAFVHKLAGWHGEPTEKQRAILDRLHKKATMP